VVQQIDDEVHDDEDAGHEHGGGADGLEIALADAVDEVGAEALPGEDGLGDDRAAEKRAGLQADDGDDGDEGVANLVAEDAAATESFGARGAHVVLALDLEHAGAGHAHDEGG